MLLQKIILTYFKNHESLTLNCGRINCITGHNGIGKTNILDAIYTLCMGKSYLASTDRQIVHQGFDFYRIEGRIEKDHCQHAVVIKYQPNSAKVIELDKRKLLGRKELIGRFPVVFFSPMDHRLVTEGSELRRKMYDAMLSQSDPEYMDHLGVYHQLLKKRNALLKDERTSRNDKLDLCLHYSMQMAGPAKYISHARAEAFNLYRAFFEEFQKDISGGAEKVLVTLQDLDDDLLEAHKKCLERDLFLKRTTLGIHRTDLSLSLEGHKLKTYGSQGQIKTAVMALKLAQYQYVRQTLDDSPIVLLDDICDRLDSYRVRHLIDLVSRDSMGQVFITDTDARRMKEILSARQREVLWTPLGQEASISKA